MRDRLVHRWLATQRTHVERDVKRAYYLSSEFLTGRSLGLCLMNIGLYKAALALAADYGFDLGDILECEGDPGWATAASAGSPPASWTRSRRWSCPRSATASATTSACSSSASTTAARSSSTTTGCSWATPWELPRHEDAQTVRFGGRVVFQHDRDGRLRADWIDTRAVIGLPYDSFIVGHRTDTVNTLRLWAARATRDFNLQFFNEGDYRRAVEEKIDTENISKVLYPNDQSEEGKALRLKQQYFFVACSIARHRPPVQAAAHATSTLFPEQGRDPAERHPPVDRGRRADARADRRGGARLGRRLGDRRADVRLHEPHAAARGAREWPVPLFERLLPRHLQIIYEINQRFLRQVQTRWPGDDDRLARMSIIEEGRAGRCAWRTSRRSARTA